MRQLDPECVKLDYGWGLMALWRLGGGGAAAAADGPVSRLLTHLSVSVANGLGEGAPSLSVLHLHWCIVGQQQMGTL